MCPFRRRRNRDRRCRACYIPSVSLEGERELKKSDVVSHVASSASLSKAESVAAVGAVFEAIQDCLAKGESVVITGFGTFSTTSRPARRGRTRGRARASTSPPRQRPRSRPARPSAMRCARVPPGSAGGRRHQASGNAGFTVYSRCAVLSWC